MIHGLHYISLKPKEAIRIETQAAEQLLKTRKLFLVLDLDQTLIHTSCCPVVGEWIQNSSQPGAGSVHAVKILGSSLTHYIKLRDGLFEFLDKVSKRYELYIYTMGNLCYAQQIVRLIDPHSRYFDVSRIVTRDHSQNGKLVKELKGVFPHNDNMVLILDDRRDVWVNGDRNLVSIKPYEYFRGAGDINRVGNVWTETRAVNTRADDYLESTYLILEEIHGRYYAELDKSAQDLLTDVRLILQQMKERILKGCNLVFDRSIPDRDDLREVAIGFGAVCSEHCDEKTTHLITTRFEDPMNKTFWIVKPGWITETIWRMKRAGEHEYSHMRGIRPLDQTDSELEIQIDHPMDSDDELADEIEQSLAESRQTNPTDSDDELAAEIEQFATQF